MHVLIDARMISDRPHGIAIHTRRLIENLLKVDKKNRYSFLVERGNKSFAMGLSPAPGMTDFWVTKSRWISLSEQLALPVLLKKLKPDLYHSPSFAIPFYCPVPFVLTLHDLNHVRCPETKRFHTTLYYQTILRRAVHRTEKIITVSQFSKKEIIDYYNVDPQKISVIYNGVDLTFSPLRNEQKLEACQKKYNLPKRFILWIGNSKKHKNLGRLIQAYEKLKTETSLLIVGAPPPLHFPRHPNIHFIKQIEQADLVSLYQLSTFLVCPSLYEGFGLPVVEALACGKRVIVSNRPPLSEIAGTAGILVEPTDVDALSKTMDQLLNDPKIDETHHQGVGQSKKFSWEKAAKQTLEIYESCHRS